MYHRRETPDSYHEKGHLEDPAWNVRGMENRPDVSGLGIPFLSRYSNPGPMITSERNQVKQWNMAYAPPRAREDQLGKESWEFVKGREYSPLSLIENQLRPSALETHTPTMPPLEKREFTPLRDVKGW